MMNAVHAVAASTYLSQNELDEVIETSENIYNQVNLDKENNGYVGDHKSNIQMVSLNCQRVAKISFNVKRSSVRSNQYLQSTCSESLFMSLLCYCCIL